MSDIDKWVENSVFSLTNYMDWKEGKSDENSIIRWNKLPESLRNLLGTPGFIKRKK